MLCECGCGRETTIYNRKPRRFIHGHNMRTHQWHEMPTCWTCGESLITDNWHLSSQNKHEQICKKCANERSRQQHMKNIENRREIVRRSRYNHGTRPMNENTECPSFLGVHVTERVLRHVFNNVEQMPYGNPGYDFVCGNGYLIDSKSSCTRYNGNDRSPFWGFAIRRNKVADYFVLLAFDNRDDITPLHIWMIPGHVINHLTGVSISESTIDKWDEYRLDIDKVITCCNEMKS